MENTITIVLVGESGVGKSTFINAFVNYLVFDSMKEAEKDVKCLIPTKFTVFDKKDRKLKEVYFGQPDPQNEDIDSTQSGTKNCKCYTFKLEDITLRIIDTPGIGDTSAVIKDNINMGNILSFISQYKEINAICVLLKPNIGRDSLQFRYCVLEMLSHLNKSAQDNILFVFTNTRATFYQPGNTAPTLMKILNEAKSVTSDAEIKFEDQNTFCLDNELFRYLVAVSEPNNVMFSENVKTCYEESWKRSVTESQRLLSYIKGLKPHLVADTLALNDIREKIILLNQPIRETTTSISDEIKKYENQRKIIKEFISDLQELKKQTIIGFIAEDIISTPLDRPITVCIHPDCSQEILINGSKKMHYKSICHNPCYLKHKWANVCGNISILDCQAFNKYEDKEDIDWHNNPMSLPEQFDGPDSDTDDNLSIYKYINRTKSEICFKCGHSFHTHMLSTIETKVVRKEIKDDPSFKRVTDNEELIQTQKDLIKGIERKIFHLKFESDIIANIWADFASFLKNNALIPYNLATDEYLQWAMDEKLKPTINWDPFEINQSEEALRGLLEHNQMDNYIILNAIERKDLKSDRISSEYINEKLTQLFNLEKWGQNIEYGFKSQNVNRNYALECISRGRPMVLECAESEDYSEWGSW